MVSAIRICDAVIAKDLVSAPRPRSNSLTTVPRKESRYPLASFCNRNDAASIVLNRLSQASAFVISPPVMSIRGRIPLFDFIIPVVCLLDMTCSNQHQYHRRDVGAYLNSGQWFDAPVFIITCVVARLTFFLKPGQVSM
jgi:hypothetical protein